MQKNNPGIFAIGLIILLLASCQSISTPGDLPYQEVRIPSTGAAGQTLQAFVYHPNDHAKHDVVIINHGSAGGHPEDGLPAVSQAAYFVEKGYTVIAPMRKGRGASDGISLESEEKNCDVNSWKPGIESASDDLTAAIEYALTLPDFDHQIILAGISRGGYLSVAYAAQGKYKDKVAAVINFSGSWVAQTEDQCPQDFNLVSFSALGDLPAPPNLWLYADNDGFNDAASIRAYHAGFSFLHPDERKLVMFSNVPGNGHFVADYREIWEKDVSAFLEQFLNK